MAHRSQFAADLAGPRQLFLEDGEPFDLNRSRRFPKGFDIYREPYEGYTHPPRFLLQEEETQYAVRNLCPEVTWNLYGFPMPDVSFVFEGKEIEMGDKYSFNYSRNGVVSLQVIPILVLLYVVLGNVKCVTDSALDYSNTTSILVQINSDNTTVVPGNVSQIQPWDI